MNTRCRPETAANTVFACESHHWSATISRYKQDENSAEQLAAKFGLSTRQWVWAHVSVCLQHGLWKDLDRVLFSQVVYGGSTTTQAGHAYLSVPTVLLKIHFALKGSTRRPLECVDQLVVRLSRTIADPATRFETCALTNCHALARDTVQVGEQAASSIAAAAQRQPHDGQAGIHAKAILILR